MSAITKRQIPLSVPYLSGNEWEYLKECLDSGWVSTAGPQVVRFEQEVARVTDSPYAVAVASGTAALHLALKAVGVQRRDLVIVSDITFIASVNAIHYCGADPIFMDADKSTWQMDANKLQQFFKEECVTTGKVCTHRKTGRRISAIVPVHIMGLSCEIDRIVSLAHDANVLVVEDAAEAMGVRYRQRHVGTYGDAGVFSFNGNKIVTAGGGGIVVTSQPQIEKRVRYLSTQAKDDELENIHNDIGFNYRLTSLQAALGFAQMAMLDRFIEKKRTIAAAYTKAFSLLSGVELMPTSPHTDPTYWLYTILLPKRTSLEERKHFIRRLIDQGVFARPFWHPIHSLIPYKTCEAYRIENANDLYARGVSLPSSVGLTDDDLAYCIEAVQRSFKSA